MSRARHASTALRVTPKWAAISGTPTGWHSTDLTIAKVPTVRYNGYMTSATYHQHSDFGVALLIAAIVPACFLLGMLVGVLLGLAAL